MFQAAAGVKVCIYMYMQKVSFIVIFSNVCDSYFISVGVPGRPQNAKGTEDLRIDDRCVIFLTWDAPLDYNEEDIDHYIIQIPSANNLIQTNEKSTLISISIPRCIPDIYINISAVDRCGREGPSTVVPHLDSSTMNETAPTEQVTTLQENRSGRFVLLCFTQFTLRICDLCCHCS